jgi:probable HAF family extracellular repeat protein
VGASRQIRTSPERVIPAFATIYYTNHMKPTRTVLIALCILAINASAQTPAELQPAQTRYTVTPIAQGEGNGINNEGDVVGTLDAIFQVVPSYIADHAFLYKRGKLTDLGAPTVNDESFALAINDTDEVAGSIFEVEETIIIRRDAFFYRDGKMVVFANGVTEGADAQANAINNRGEIVGSHPMFPITFYSHAFVYTNGTLLDLGTLGGIQSFAYGINNAGTIVGVAQNTEGVGEAFLYSNGRMQSIGGSLSSNFVPFAINDNGWITGELNTSTTTTTGTTSTTDAVLYINGKLYNLGTLAGFTGSAGVSINNSGTVIGTSTLGVFIYSGGKMYDLNALLETGGWKVTGVGHINDVGQIAATGTYGGQTITYALLLTPVSGHLLP